MRQIKRLASQFHSDSDSEMTIFAGIWSTHRHPLCVNSLSGQSRVCASAQNVHQCQEWVSKLEFSPGLWPNRLAEPSWPRIKTDSRVNPATFLNPKFEFAVSRRRVLLRCCSLPSFRSGLGTLQTASTCFTTHSFSATSFQTATNGRTSSKWRPSGASPASTLSPCGRRWCRSWSHLVSLTSRRPASVTLSVSRQPNLKSVFLITGFIYELRSFSLMRKS